MMVSIEQHVDWIADCHGPPPATTARPPSRPTKEAEDFWVQHNLEVGDATLYPLANSWYMGSNVPGKPRVLMPYIGGVGVYREECDDIVADGYRGFVIRDAGLSRGCLRRGRIRRSGRDTYPGGNRVGFRDDPRPDARTSSMRYDGRAVVDGVSFTVDDGEIFAIVGRNGAGKTTIVESIEGLRRPDSGRIRVLGLDPYRHGAELRQRRRRSTSPTEWRGTSR